MTSAREHCGRFQKTRSLAEITEAGVIHTSCRLIAEVRSIRGMLQNLHQVLPSKPAQGGLKGF